MNLLLIDGLVTHKLFTHELYFMIQFFVNCNIFSFVWCRTFNSFYLRFLIKKLAYLELRYSLTVPHPETNVQSLQKLEQLTQLKGDDVFV